jgi:glucose 1-dehydrogenase
MRAIAVSPKRKNSAELMELDDPRPGMDECLVDVLEVGMDATDREIAGGEYGEAPAGEARLVIGHECVGRVRRGPRGGGDRTGVREGDLVVPMVRRPCPQRCPNCDAGAEDFCSTGDYLERGIKGAHGYLCERFTERPDYLVPVPEQLRTVAVLLEPLAILERTYRQIFEIQQRMIWAPRLVLITGAGNMGIMGALLARLADLETVVYSRGPGRGAAGGIMEQIGCSYVDSEEQELDRVVKEFGNPDIAIEGTGFSPLAWQCAGALATNGVACLLSVTHGDATAEIPSDELNTKLVLGNRTVFGSVNAHRTDFEQGVDDLLAIRERWPGALERFITHRRRLGEFRDALEEDDPAELKTIIEVSDDRT